MIWKHYYGYGRLQNGSMMVATVGYDIAAE